MVDATLVYDEEGGSAFVESDDLIPGVERRATIDEFRCPRCGLKQFVIWGSTDCASCGLHFECC